MSIRIALRFLGRIISGLSAALDAIGDEGKEQIAHAFRRRVIVENLGGAVNMSILGSQQVQEVQPWRIAAIGVRRGIIVGAIVQLGFICYRSYGRKGWFVTKSTNIVCRVLQRFVVDSTRQEFKTKFHPIEHVIESLPTRFSDNGHAVSGAVRDSARRAIAAAVDAYGGKAYELSPAAQSTPDLMQHKHFAVGDLGRAMREDAVDAKCVITGIDVDYYLENPDDLICHDVPILFYTFAPRKVAGMDGDCSYRIDDDVVTYEVSGGGSWKHEIWDWTGYGEFVEGVSHDFWPRVLYWTTGLVKKHYAKVVFARPWKHVPDRALVWLLPVASSYEFAWIKREVTGRKLSRVRYADPKATGWNRAIYWEGNEMLINLGQAGADATITMKKTDYDAYMCCSTSQSVISRMISNGVKDGLEHAMMASYYNGVTNQRGEILARGGKPVRMPEAHWPVANSIDQPVVAARVYSVPIVNSPNLMPMTKRWESLSNSIERRITMVGNKTVPGPRFQAFAHEFVQLVVPEAGVGVPYTHEETRELLDKPSQKVAVNLVWETMGADCRRLIECFIKNEPTMKNGRIISSFPDARYLLKFSAFTLKFREDVLHAEHNRHWFMPGRTPAELALAVCEYVAGVGSPLEGDYANMDGTVSAWLQRTVMNAVYLRYFEKQFTEELRGHTDMLITCPARAKRFGWKYDAGVGVKSGSPTTCDLNTVCNAYVMYCAIRLTMPELTKEEAFRLIGLAFGDDSLFDQIFSGNFVKVAKALGMELKAEKFSPDKGVCFLARVFPNPWATATSFQDPVRTWRKLHITARDPLVPLADAAVDRLTGYLITDRLSPIVGAYAKKVVELMDPITTNKRMERLDRNREKPYYANDDGPWPQLPEDTELMYACASARSGISVEMMRKAEELISGADSVWNFPTLGIEDGASPYVDHIDAEGITAGALGDRFQLDRDAQFDRVARKFPTTNRRQGGGPGQRASPAGPADGSNGKGRSGVPDVPDALQKQGKKGNGSSPGKTGAEANLGEGGSAPKGGSGQDRKDGRRPGKKAAKAADGVGTA